MIEIDYSQTSKELDDWFPFQSWTFVLVTLAIYLFIVLKVGPTYMAKRKPYKLKTFITVYNIGQVLACLYIVTEILNLTSFRVFYFWKCTVFPRNTRAEYLFYRVSCFTFWLKVVELIETIVFVLRKKQNQVSFLHVFHHCSTVTLLFVLIKYYRDGSALYPVLLNSIVHIFMYSYYLTTAVCSKELLKRLISIKKSITIMQMVQFVMILIQAAVMMTHCNMPYVIVFYYLTVVCVIFYGFYDFYKKSYTLKNSRNNST